MLYPVHGVTSATSSIKTCIAAIACIVRRRRWRAVGRSHGADIVDEEGEMVDRPI